MSSIVTHEGVLHYEAVGRGQPVILLHGWINSWSVWRDSMLSLAATRRYRFYALDFWGFGDSSKGTRRATPSFQMAAYVKMVHEFMERLGIVAAPLLGHSMGGTVALQFALNYPERVQKVVVVGSPIVGSSLNIFLKLAGLSPLADIVRKYPHTLGPLTERIIQIAMNMLLARESTRVREMIFSDWQRTTYESFFRSINDLKRTDLRRDLPTLEAPTLGIYGTKDNIVSPRNAELLNRSVRRSQVSLMERSRHFPMTDEPQKFMTTLDGFLGQGAAA